MLFLDGEFFNLFINLKSNVEELGNEHNKCEAIFKEELQQKEEQVVSVQFPN